MGEFPRGYLLEGKVIVGSWEQWHECKISLGCENKIEDVDSALALYIVENLHHLVLSDGAALISEANGFPHSFRNTNEITRIHKKKLALNKDTGDIPINPIYNNLKRKD